MLFSSSSLADSVESSPEGFLSRVKIGEIRFEFKSLRLEINLSRKLSSFLSLSELYPVDVSRTLEISVFSLEKRLSLEISDNLSLVNLLIWLYFWDVKLDFLLERFCKTSE